MIKYSHLPLCFPFDFPLNLLLFLTIASLFLLSSFFTFHHYVSCSLNILYYIYVSFAFLLLLSSNVCFHEILSVAILIVPPLPFLLLSTDLATLSSLSKHTGGFAYYYPAFYGPRDGMKFDKELRRCLTRSTGFESGTVSCWIERVRISSRKSED